MESSPFFTYFFFFHHLVDSPYGIARNPDGSFGCCKFAYGGLKCCLSWSDSDGRLFVPRWENSWTSKLPSGTLEFLAIPGGLVEEEKHTYVKNCDISL